MTRRARERRLGRGRITTQEGRAAAAAIPSGIVRRLAELREVPEDGLEVGEAARGAVDCDLEVGDHPELDAGLVEGGLEEVSDHGDGGVRFAGLTDVEEDGRGPALLASPIRRAQ